MPELLHGESEAAWRPLRALKLATELSIVILAVEAVGAYLSHSLSLTVDAAHNVPDILAFAVSWTALQATEHGATAKYTYGAHRLEVFAALLNAALVLGVGVGFGYVAITALLVNGSFFGSIDPIWILAAAIPTLALRYVSLSVIARLPRQARDLNLASVLVHLASDLLITGALLIAGILLLVHPSFHGADAGAALVIAAILVYESIPLFRGGWEVLTERTPRHLSLEAIGQSLRSAGGVSEVHDLHVWAVCPTLVCMTAHLIVPEMSLRDSMRVVAKLRRRMEAEYGILHATFEVEAVGPG
ncbi:MAG: cation diffusion facilitator family transporter [Thermoplasmata archaeon]